jgi:hypothetical protein
MHKQRSKKINMVEKRPNQEANEGYPAIVREHIWMKIRQGSCLSPMVKKPYQGGFCLAALALFAFLSVQ